MIHSRHRPLRNFLKEKSSSPKVSGTTKCRNPEPKKISFWHFGVFPYMDTLEVLGHQFFILTGYRLSAADPDPMHRSKWCNRKRSDVGVTAHVIAPASKIVSHCRSLSHLFLFTILPVKRTQETRNIHSSTLLSTSMTTKGCGIQFYFLFLPAFTKLNP